MLKYHKTMQKGNTPIKDPPPFPIINMKDTWKGIEKHWFEWYVPDSPVSHKTTCTTRNKTYGFSLAEILIFVLEKKNISIMKYDSSSILLDFKEKNAF